jgi:hypothetical protein
VKYCLLANNWKALSLALLTVSTFMMLSAVASVGQTRKPTMIFAISGESGAGSMREVYNTIGDLC